MMEILVSREMAGSVMVGVVFGGINFWLLARIVGGMIQSETVSPWKTAVFFLLKMTFLFATIVLLLKKGYVSPLPFLGGFTLILIVGITLTLILQRLRQPQEKV
jgi:hypothetical protein